MSFTSEVKDEVSKIDFDDVSKISELSAVVLCSYVTDDILVTTENNSVARRVYTLFKDVCGVYPKVTVRTGYNYNKKKLYLLSVKSDGVLERLGIDGSVCDRFIVDDDDLAFAFLAGVFMMCGSINDPKKNRYHLEFNVVSYDFALFVSDLLNRHLLNSKVLHRDSRYMVYVKEAEKIGDFLKMIGAFHALFYYEDIRIYRDHKNMTNRLNNCEQANVDRVIETSNGQVDDIEVVMSGGGLDLLDDKERVVAEYRLKYKDASLLELSEIISLETGNKISKSGLYHRFKKIKSLADKIRKSG